MFARTPTELERRVALTQTTLDAWIGRTLDWKKRDHCVRLVAEHLRRCGYTPPLSKGGPFSSPLGAMRALQRAGVATLGEAVDLVPGLFRIAPAAALVGDIVELPGEGALGALTIALGNGRVAGWHGDAEDLKVLQPSQFIAAWRVTPR